MTERKLRKQSPMLVDLRNDAVLSTVIKEAQADAVRDLIVFMTKDSRRVRVQIERWK